MYKGYFEYFRYTKRRLISVLRNAAIVQHHPADTLRIHTTNIVNQNE